MLITGTILNKSAYSSSSYPSIMDSAITQPITQEQETPVESPSAFKNPHDKKGRSTSCFLCQKRKQKCDHRLPSCTTCIKAGVKCIQPAKYAVKAPEKDEYTIMLEKKVKFLEKILDANNIMIDQQGNPNVKKNFKYKKLSPFLPEDQKQTLITDGTSIPSINIPSDRKLPLLNQVELKKSTASTSNYISMESVDYNNSIFAKYNLKDYLSLDPVFEVDEKLSRAFLDIHFTRLQFKYPLFDEDEIFEFHNAYVTNNLAGYMNDLDYFHYNCCRMWMIFAISSCLHMTTGRYKGPPPARYFSTAIRHITKVKRIDDLKKIEILTLTVLYLIRTDRDSVYLYDIIKDALELCVSLKLNRSQTYWSLLPKERMRNIRIWWCVYLLERMITIAVGKPYSLSESQVDPDLPLFEYHEPSSRSGNNKIPNNVNFINQSIKLRRIESRFVENLNITTSIDLQQDVSIEQLPKVEKFFQELEIWRGNCQVFNNVIENETLRLYYYRSVRLLLQPFIELMDPTDKLFRECQAAAGHICQLFKVFHEKTVFGHSTTAIHTVFVAGVTVIYCLWVARNKDDLKRKQLGDVSKHTRPAVSESLFSGLNDLRACSICLYVMTERSKFGLIFRETFDQLMHATIGNLIERCGPDASELIYNNEPGMPPAIVRKYNSFKLNGLINDNQTKTEEERVEQAERRRRQGQLQKKSVPKSLSHLLINSAPTFPEENESDQYNSQQIKRQKTSSQTTPSSSSNLISTPLSGDNMNIPQNEVNLNSFQYPMSNYTTTSTSSAPSLTSISQTTTPQSTSTITGPPTSATTIPTEFTLFNGRTNKMINNISVWTGESGGTPITSSLFDHSIYLNNNKGLNGNNAALNSAVSGLTSLANGNMNNLNNLSANNGNTGNGNGNDNLLWNVPVEEFWANNDDYGFLA